MSGRAPQRRDSRRADRAIIGRPVDIVDLDTASPLLAFQALRHGRLLVDRNVSRRIRFSAALPGRREDLLRVRRPIEERLAARLGRGAGGG